MAETDPHRRGVLFSYWGRRGAMSRFTLNLAAAANANANFDALVSISLQNENVAEFAPYQQRLLPVQTYSSHLGALAGWRALRLRRQIGDFLRARDIGLVIELMPHVWSGFVAGAIRNAGARYCTIVHDAHRHPGDPTGWVKDIADKRAIAAADGVMTLSHAVAEELVAEGRVAKDRIGVLFHPAIQYGGPAIVRPPRQVGQPLRLLFFGRIQAYKGLPLFVEMAEMLRKNGVAVDFGVFGEGDLAPNEERLNALGAEVVNRWLSDAEIEAILARYDVMVLSHVEASQSGVAAAAIGAGMPLVATPVGGLPEQIGAAGVGLIAERVDAAALYDAVMTLHNEPEVYRSLCATISRQAGTRSMSDLMREAVATADRIAPPVRR